jgi:hypothetical protein
MDDRFRYEDCERWGGDLEQRKRWFEALERTGPERVRARLASGNFGSPAAISISTEQTLTVGFAEEWLAWHDRQKAQRETAFRSNQIYWTRWAAFAATDAVLVGAIGWAITIVVRH